MADTPEEIKSHFKLYGIITGVLILGTIITVLVAIIPALDVGEHGFDYKDAILGLLIATTKASCVGAVFMHLNHEKKAIYWIFFGTFFFAFALVALIMGAAIDPITFEGHLPEKPGM